MKKIIIHPIGCSQWPKNKIAKSKKSIGHISSKFVTNDTAIEIRAGEDPDTILNFRIQELKQGYKIKYVEELLKKRSARQKVKEEQKNEELSKINVMKEANLITDPYIRQIFLINNNIKTDQGFINQKNLIARRKEFGIKTIAEAKKIIPDKEHKKRSSAGYTVTEYLFSVERLNQRIFTDSEIEERKSYLNELQHY